MPSDPPAAFAALPLTRRGELSSHVAGVISPREFVRPREEIGLVSGKERSWLAPTVTRRFETSSVLKSGVKKGGVLREAKTVPSLV